MKHIFIFFGLVTLVLTASGASGEDLSAMRTVAVVRQEIVLDPMSANRRALTGDGVPKAWPLWSKGGTRIAFWKQVPESLALGNVVVVDLSGKQLASFIVEPVESGLAYVGMRGIESMQWLNEDSIVVGGSINPSQSQYYVFHLDSRAAQNFIDDRSAPAFSPDGRSFAIVTGAPHWKSKGDLVSAVLEVGSLASFPRKTAKYKVGDVVSGPVWSPDGASLVLLDQGQNSSGMRLFVREERHGGQWIAAPADLPADTKLYWQGDTLEAVAADKGRMWWVSLKRRKFIEVADKAPQSPQETAIALQQQMRQKLQSKGAIEDADFWCADCPLAELPRKTSNGE